MYVIGPKFYCCNFIDLFKDVAYFANLFLKQELEGRLIINDSQTSSLNHRLFIFLISLYVNIAIELKPSRASVPDYTSNIDQRIPLPNG